MGMNGLGYIHSDAGGFAQGVKDEELYTRWLQFAAFTPIFRPHGSGIPSEPVYFSPATQNIVKPFMRLRYIMLPYNYTLAWENAMTGAPLMRPLYYYHDDSISRSVQDQYYWGESILVAPILEKGAQTRRVWLPEGEWYSVFPEKKMKGGSWYEENVYPEFIPVYVKAGSFIPLADALNTTDQYKADQYAIYYYPAGKTIYTQFEDDGKSRQSLADNQYELIRYEGNSEGGKTSVMLSKTGSWPGMPTKRMIQFRVFLQGTVGSVLLNGKALENLPHGKRPSYQISGKFADIYFEWDGRPVHLEIIDK
jgi:oligosaccharide 4-alpha-D-glucosyltransferase